MTTSGRLSGIKSRIIALLIFVEAVIVVTDAFLVWAGAPSGVHAVGRSDADLSGQVSGVGGVGERNMP